MPQYLNIQKCPHCLMNRPNLKYAYGTNASDHLGRITRLWEMYICGNCGSGVMAAYIQGGTALIDYYPKPEYLIDDGLPDKVTSYLQQAIDTLHAPSGSIMLSAASIDAMLKEKGLITGNLYNRINQAAKDHLITEDMAKWAHEVRLEANDERHADINSSLPDQAEALHVVDFAKALAEILFTLPNKIKRGISEAKQNISEG